MATRRRIRSPRVALWPAVSASPRAVAAYRRGCTLPDLRRCMLFPEGFGRFTGHRTDGCHARFFDLSVAVLELKNHRVIDSPDGLVLLQHDRDTTVSLLQPFTLDVADFPDIVCFPHQLHETTIVELDEESEEATLLLRRQMATQRSWPRSLALASLIWRARWWP